MEALKQDPTMNILSLQQGPYWQRSRWDEAVEKNIGLVEEADRETLKAQIAILTKTMEEQNHFF